MVAAASTTVAAVASATGLAASATRLGDTLDDAVTGNRSVLLREFRSRPASCQ